MSSEVLISSSANAGTNYFYSSLTDNIEGASFKFPYQQAPTDNIIKEISEPSRGVYITKISNENKYYINYIYGGLSGARTIDNSTLVVNKKGKLTDPAYKDVLKLNKGATLANCVGWAHGRVNEIWGTAKSSGFIVKQDDNWVIPSKNNEIVNCGREPGVFTTPASDAFLFYDRWPTTSGWSKTALYTDDKRPCPGAIICWRNMLDPDGLNGHVAMVEAVYNYGQPNESILISQSGYSLTGAKKIVWTQEIKRSSMSYGAPYSYGSNYKFAGFLFSPVCQLLSDGTYFATGQQHYTLEDVELLKADQTKYEAINNALTSSTKVTDLVKGQKVEIVWFGSTTPNDTNSKINLLGGAGIVVSVDKSNIYPYSVSITGDNVVSGYFDRGSLKVVK